MREQIREATDQTIEGLREPGTTTGTRGLGQITPGSRQSVTRSAAVTERAQNATAPEAAGGWQPNKRALFIGNNDYSPQKRLSKCVNDAREMQKLFADLRHRLVYDFDLNHDSMRKTFARFKEDIEVGDELVVSFSGHGVQVNSELYLLPTDAPLIGNPLEVSSTCINLHPEIDEMFARGAKMVLAIVDACRQQMRIDYEHLYHQGVEPGIEVAEQFNSLEKSAIAAPRKSAGVPRTGAYGRGLVFATSHDTSAIEYGNMQHGVFTHYFLQEARVRGRTIQQVIERVRQQVTVHTQNQQTPSFHNDLNGDFYFLP